MNNGLTYVSHNTGSLASGATTKHLLYRQVVKLAIFVCNYIKRKMLP